MTTESMSALLTALRVIGYAGFVLWAGPLIFWSLVGPAGQRHRRLVRLSGVGAVLLVLTSVAEPALRLTAGGQTLDEVAPPLAGAAVLLRLAILVASLFYLTDLVAGTVVGTRRAVALGSIVLVATTMALQPTVLGQPSPVLAAFGTAGHLLATAAWLGGLVALASVVRPGAQAGEAGGLVTRFSPVATLGLLLLVAASTLTVLAAAAGRAGLGGGGGGGSGLVLRLALLGALLVVAGYAHRVTARLAFRRLFSPAAATGPARERAVTSVVGTQLAIAFGALSAAMLVCLTA
jgi:copper transport protein